MVCNSATGVGKAKPVKPGTEYADIVSFTAEVSDTERDVIIGADNNMYTTGSFALFAPSGGVIPRWAITTIVPMPYAAPTVEELADVQDDPPACTLCDEE